MTQLARQPVGLCYNCSSDMVNGSFPIGLLAITKIMLGHLAVITRNIFRRLFTQSSPARPENRIAKHFVLFSLSSFNMTLLKKHVYH